MLSRAMLNASKTSVVVQKRNFISIPDIIQLGFYCTAPIAVSGLTLMMQIEIDDYTKLRARVTTAKKGCADDKAEAIEAATRSTAFGRANAVKELLSSIPDTQKYDLSCGKSPNIRNAFMASCFSGDRALAALILSKTIKPCVCVTSAFEKDNTLKCTSKSQRGV